MPVSNARIGRTLKRGEGASPATLHPRNRPVARQRGDPSKLMERHFLLPISIAAAVHAGVFLGLQRHLPTLRPAPPAEASSERFPSPTIDLKPQVVDETDVVAAPSAPSDTPRLPDVINETSPKDFLTVFHPETDQVRVLAPVYRVSEDAMKGGIRNGGGPGIVSQAALDRTPEARVRIAPEYPPAARRDGREGEVVVEFVVDEAGRVVEAHAVRSTDAVFDDAAVRAVLRWRFNPGTARAQSVKFRMAVPIVFKLDQN